MKFQIVWSNTAGAAGSAAYLTMDEALLALRSAPTAAMAREVDTGQRYDAAALERLVAKQRKSG